MSLSVEKLSPFNNYQMRRQINSPCKCGGRDEYLNVTIQEHFLDRFTVMRGQTGMVEPNAERESVL